ncbi:MAG: hypothetical protein K0Q49_244 [Haloplasmataceae bacterium]|jgi:hypothetical protein|nr:hypothetical protein [Haloplasmataceae bacterium]
MKLIPQPSSVTLNEGQFLIDYSTKIVILNKEEKVNTTSAEYLQSQLSLLLGFKLMITSKLNDEVNQMIYLSLTNLDEEEYEINVLSKKIQIKGGSQKGLYYGLQTFIQLVINYKANIPCLSIHDKPYFANRGFYHDITRGKVPTLETLKYLVDVAAFYKLNQLQLYVEHSFAFDNFTEIWLDATPITSEEILLLDKYCQEKHVELVPSLSTFGHLYTVLRSHSFKELCELENTDAPFGLIDRMLHHTLDVSSSKSIEFVESMIEQYIPLFSSNKFNICCDETFDLGKGKSKNLAEELGNGKLYVDFLNKVIEIVRKHNKTVMVWGDIIAKHPEYINEIANDVIFLNWDYTKNPNENRIKLFSESKKPFYQCSGTWGWNRLPADIDLSHQNILNMCKFGVDYKAIGILNTDWGDCGHLNTLSGSFPGLIYGASYAWNPTKDLDLDEINQKISFIHYQDQENQIMNLLTKLSRNTLVTHGHIVRLIETGATYQFNKDVSEDTILLTIKNVQEVEQSLSKYLYLVPNNKQIEIKELIVTAKGTELLNKFLLIIHSYELKKDLNTKINPRDLAIEFEKWFYDYSEIWRLRNKESELFHLKDLYKKLTNNLRNL